MKHHTRLTQFLIRTEDYFVGLTDKPGVRVGFVGGHCFDFPKVHPRYAVAVALTAETVEAFHDECMGVYA